MKILWGIGDAYERNDEECIEGSIEKYWLTTDRRMLAMQEVKKRIGGMDE